MTLWVTITNENTSDLAPLYTTTLLVFIRVGVQGRPSPHPMPLSHEGRGAWGEGAPPRIPQEDCSTLNLNACLLLHACPPLFPVL